MVDIPWSVHDVEGDTGDICLSRALTFEHTESNLETELILNV